LPITTGVEQYVSVSARVDHFATFFYLSLLVTPGYPILDFGGNSGVLALALPPRIKANVEFLLERG